MSDENSSPEANQTHYTRGGREYVRVTHVLKSCGLIYNGKRATQDALERGKVVHFCCRLLAEKRLNWKTVDPRLLGYVQSYERLLDHTEWLARACELTEYDDTLMFAGTFDVDFELDLLADLKTGVPARWHKAQCGAYWHLRGERGKAATIYLQEDGSIAKLKFHDARQAWRDFQIFLNYYHLKRIYENGSD